MGKSFGASVLRQDVGEAAMVSARLCRQAVKMIRVPKSVMKWKSFCVDFQLS
ncbi:hypothetical protein HDF12_004205 [Edaphobacter lichenicola]|uniref:Uncharacterized protein n=2 Tax=Tunturiibacter TaxID=3154218 RepID=A0A7Y9NQQ0_9BACT|nr:hypothetical protein [Edaphobacter lichenicola]NYF53806.1 hypothetical protein [Edaphobacter lichenicola]